MRYLSSLKQAATLILCVCLALGMAATSFAQGTNASLAGNVADVQDAGIAGATVIVKNTETAQARTVQTNSAGRYQVDNLIPGAYEVSVDAAGFSKKTLTGVILAVSQQATLNVQLLVGAQSETVSVEATGSMTETESSENGTVIDNKKVVELPLSNRQFYSLALLSPGALPPAQTSTLGFRGGFNVAGAQESTNLFTYNGVFNDAIGTQQPSFRPSVETIQEFKLQTGVYGPEYGKYSGGQVVVLEKQGGNTLHGSAYWFVRNQATDAKPYFTQKGGVNPAFRQNTFGATIGGPIFKDKTFFYGGYEGQRVNTQNTQLSTIPTANMMAGIFPGTTQLYDPYTGKKLVVHADGLYHLTDIPQFANSAASQLGIAFANYYPSGATTPSVGVIPTPANVYPTSNYVFSSTQVEKMNEYTIRIDHTFNASDSLAASYNEFHDPTTEPANTLCGSATVPNGGCFFNQMVHLVTLSESHIFNPNLLNTITAGYNRFQMPRTPTDSGLSNPPLLPGAFINPTFPNLGLPNLQISGYSTLGGPTNIPQNQWLNQYDVVDQLNWNKGAHSFKFGAEFFMDISTEIFTQNGRGAAVFNSSSLASANKCVSVAGQPPATCFGDAGHSVADFVLGIPYTTTRNPIAPNVHEGNYSFYGYFNDDWKAAKNLTLNLGLRYEMNAPAYDSKNAISRFNPDTGKIELGKGAPLPANLTAATNPKLIQYFDNVGFKYLYQWDYNNFAPRVGLAWQPFGSDKTVVKSAYGIFYNGPIAFNQYISSETQLPVRAPQTFTASAAPVDPGTHVATPVLTLASPFNGQAPGTFTDAAGTYTTFGVQLSQPTPLIHEWSLGVNQQLNNYTVLEMVYLGTHGAHLPGSRSINSTVPNGVGSAAQGDRPFPQFSTVTYAHDENASSYNSLQVKLQQAYHNGLSYLVAYTWGRSIDQNGGTGSGSNSSGNVQDFRNPQLDRGLSDFNVAHRIAISPVYELPFGKGKHFLNQGITSTIFGGFQLSGIFQFMTGRPFTVTDSASNTSGTFAGADRPNVVVGQDPNAGPKTIQKWFNTAAFQVQPAGTFGNAPRNNIIGPGTVQLDATVARSFPIYERFKGQIRVEGFNVLNHPNFFNPFSAGSQIGTTTYGSIINAYNSRELQAALRLTF